MSTTGYRANQILCNLSIKVNCSILTYIALAINSYKLWELKYDKPLLFHRGNMFPPLLRCAPACLHNSQLSTWAPTPPAYSTGPLFITCHWSSWINIVFWLQKWLSTTSRQVQLLLQMIHVNITYSIWSIQRDFVSVKMKASTPDIWRKRRNEVTDEAGLTETSEASK